MLLSESLKLPVAHFIDRVRQLLPLAVTLVLLVVLLAMIASTYVGHARSPYDTCYGANGRAVSCTVLDGLR